jgi:hypothetical protein
MAATEVVRRLRWCNLFSSGEFAAGGTIRRVASDPGGGDEIFGGAERTVAAKPGIGEDFHAVPAALRFSSRVLRCSTDRGHVQAVSGVVNPRPPTGCAG